MCMTAYNLCPLPLVTLLQYYIDTTSILHFCFHYYTNTTCICQYYSILLNTTQYYSICHNQIQHQYYKTYSITTNLHHNTASIQKTYIQYYSILQKSILHNTTPILHQLPHYYINTTPILHQYYINTTSILHQYYINTTRLCYITTQCNISQYSINTTQYYSNTTSILLRLC